MIKNENKKNDIQTKILMIQNVYITLIYNLNIFTIYIS